MSKTILRSPIFTAVLFVVAAVLLLGGTIGAVQAAPRTQSNDIIAEMNTSSVHTAISENGKTVTDGKLLGNLLGEGESFRLDKEYDEVLAVENTGSTPEFVRATVRVYWTDDNGKQLYLDPELVHLNFLTDNGWSIDDEASGTPKERTVLYYSEKVEAGKSTPPFADKISIDSKVLTSVTGEEYDYEGMQFNVEVTADAVQDHNSEAAMTSAWGLTA